MGRHRRWYLEQYQCIDDFLDSCTQPPDDSLPAATPTPSPTHMLSYEIHSLRCDATPACLKAFGAIDEQPHVARGQRPASGSRGRLGTLGKMLRFPGHTFRVGSGQAARGVPEPGRVLGGLAGSSRSAGKRCWLLKSNGFRGLPRPGDQLRHMPGPQGVHHRRGEHCLRAAARTLCSGAATAAGSLCFLEVRICASPPRLAVCSPRLPRPVVFVGIPIILRFAACGVALVMLHPKVSATSTGRLEASALAAVFTRGMRPRGSRSSESL